MEEMIKVSLIVPMYHCENFVLSLLDNLCGQDIEEIEIICVIDGSPDNSYTLCKSYAEKDPKVRVVTQEHKGAGAARNLGISIARGKYLMFPDADDLYEKNYVSRMLDAVEKDDSDVAICCFRYEDSILNTFSRNTGYSCIFYPKNKGIPPSHINNLIIHVSNMPHNKIYKRELVETHNLCYSETISRNDMLFSTTALISADKVVLISDILFTYRKHKNTKSISTTRGNYPMDIVTVYRELYKWLKERGIFHLYKQSYFIKCANDYKYYSQFCKHEDFKNIIANELACEEPWINVDDDEKSKYGFLYTAKTSRRLNKFKKQLQQKSITPDKRDELLHRCDLAETEINNITEIKHILKEKYGRETYIKDNIINQRLTQVKLVGLIDAIQITCKKIVNKLL